MWESSTTQPIKSESPGEEILRGFLFVELRRRIDFAGKGVIIMVWLRMIFSLFIAGFALFTTPMFGTSQLKPQAPPSEDECSRCHGNKEARASERTVPLLPEYFSMQWDMYEFTSESRPPFASVKAPKFTIHGVTHYDSSTQSMTEIYQERCIDIFESGRDFSCQFLSVGPSTYLIKFAKNKPTEAESCCKWSNDPFFAPRRDVLRNMKLDQVMTFKGKKSKWLVLDIPLPGPFGYGIYEDGSPAAFWFPVISGWVQQEFRSFELVRPNPKVFAVPPICLEKNRICEK